MREWYVLRTCQSLHDSPYSYDPREVSADTDVEPKKTRRASSRALRAPRTMFQSPKNRGPPVSPFLILLKKTQGLHQMGASKPGPKPASVTWSPSTSGATSTPSVSSKLTTTPRLDTLYLIFHGLGRCKYSYSFSSVHFPDAPWMRATSGISSSLGL